MGLGAALVLHAVLLWSLSQVIPVQSETLQLAVIDVTLIERGRPAPPKPEITPPPAAVLPPRPKPPKPAPPILATPEDVMPTDETVAAITPQIPAVPVPKAGSHPDKTYVPSRWALNPTLSDENLIGFNADIKCMQSLSQDCSDMRKEVFAKEQLTDTELVWTKKYAHTGLPAEFYGMSERQIRARLGIPNAGENGQVIIPDILTLDGPIWDAMHGVNKTCKLKIAPGFPMGFIKDCGSYRPAAKDEKYVIPNAD